MSEYSWKQAQEDRGKQLNAYAAAPPAVATPSAMLVSGLLAKLSELERLAESASPGPWHANPEHDEVWAVDDIPVAEGFALSNNQLRNTVGHIVAHDPLAVLRLCRAHRDLVKRFQWAWDRRNTGTDDEQALRQMYVIAMIDVLSDLARGLGVEEQSSE